MTKCGKRAYARSTRNARPPPKAFSVGQISRRFIAGAAEMNAWRREVKGHSPCLEQTLYEDGLLGVEAVFRLVEDLAGVLLEHL